MATAETGILPHVDKFHFYYNCNDRLMHKNAQHQPESQCRGDHRWQTTIIPMGAADEALRRWMRQNSAKSPVREGVQPMKEALPTSSALMKPARPDAKAAQRSAVTAIIWPRLVAGEVWRHQKDVTSLSVRKLRIPSSHLPHSGIAC